MANHFQSEDLDAMDVAMCWPVTEDGQLIDFISESLTPEQFMELLQDRQAIQYYAEF